MNARLSTAVRTLAIACALLAVCLSYAGAASAADADAWANESTMKNSYTGRGTFVVDPGRTLLWDRDRLISEHLAFYRGEGFANILLWAPLSGGYDPGAGTWAGCKVPHFGACPQDELDSGPVANDLIDPHITVLEWHNAFIAMSCGNFSGLRIDGPTPTISGMKFEDVNANGTRDAGEPGLSGWTIQLLQHGNVLAATQTDGNGNYAFALDANALPIDAEDFEVREVQQDGWVASRTPGSIHVGFGSVEQTFGGNDFGNYRPATIRGVKYEDLDADGGRNGDDPLLSGWTFDLSGGPSAPASQQTGVDGSYAFAGLRPGTYTVAEEQQAGWRYSSPADGSRTITVRSGDDVTAEFGNYRPATIQGVKFDDHDVNRQRDAADGGLQGWTISLSGGRSPNASTTTASDGTYRFDGLIPGTYTVAETQQAHWRQSAPASGTRTITVRSGDVTGAQDFGNVCLGSVNVTVAGQSKGLPVAGVDVRIEEVDVPGVLTNDPALPRTATAPATFGDLLPGSYRVIMFLPAHTYTTDTDLRVVDHRLAIVRRITVSECSATAVRGTTIDVSFGKVTGGMKMELPDGYATAGFQFQTKLGVPTGTLEYIDHRTGLDLHTDQIEAIWVTRTDAWIGGMVSFDGVMQPFVLHLVDNGEPGTDDRFELTVANGYRVGFNETIDGGNDQIHPPEPAV